MPIVLLGIFRKIAIQFKGFILIRYMDELVFNLHILINHIVF